MEYIVIYTKLAKQCLLTIPPDHAQNILDKIDFFIDQPHPLQYAKKLKFSKQKEYRFRIGSYRARFKIDYNGNICILSILKVIHRKDAYRN